MERIYSLILINLKKVVELFVVISIVTSPLHAIPTLKNTPYPFVDTQNMYNALYSFPEQIIDAMAFSKKIRLKYPQTPIKNIVFAGMGASAVIGDIATLVCKDYAQIPMVINRNYMLPGWVDQDSLVILISYSGDTEETIACLDDAVKRNAHIIGITSGGTLQQKLEEQDLPAIIIPEGMHSSRALAYLLCPLLHVLDFFDQANPYFELQLRDLTFGLKYYREKLSSDDVRKNFALAFAHEVINKIPCICAEANTTEHIAHRFRDQLAENSKLFSTVHLFPEINHNHIVSFQNPTDKTPDFGIIWILDGNIHGRNSQQMTAARALVNNKVAYQKTIRCSGQSYLERSLLSIYICDWICYWSAILQKIDPMANTNINLVKHFMKQQT